MTMRIEDMHEIVAGTVDHFRVRCAHRQVVPSDKDLEQLAIVANAILACYVDNSADTGGEWDNA